MNARDTQDMRDTQGMIEAEVLEALDAKMARIQAEHAAENPIGWRRTVAPRIEVSGDSEAGSGHVRVFVPGSLWKIRPDAMDWWSQLAQEMGGHWDGTNREWCFDRPYADAVRRPLASRDEIEAAITSVFGTDWDRV